MDYQNPVQIEVEMAPSFTKAALNRCLFITNEHKSGGEGTVASIKTFSSSKEVSEYYGNNSKIYAAIELFLNQKIYPAKQALIPDYFHVLSVKKTGATKADVIKALNELGSTVEYYAISHILEPEVMTPGALNSFCNEKMKRCFETTTTETITDSEKSDRYIKFIDYSNENKAIAYMATCITPGAGSKSDMNILSGVTADVSGGKKVELSKVNINFAEKRTSKDYVVARMGVATDGTDITEGTATDCIIYNLIDNIETAMAETGFKQDTRGYSLLETIISNVMGEMYQMGIIADLNGRAEYKVYPITQTASERQAKVIRPKCMFRLADYGKVIELTLERTFEEVNK